MRKYLFINRPTRFGNWRAGKIIIISILASVGFLVFSGPSLGEKVLFPWLQSNVIGPVSDFISPSEISAYKMGKKFEAADGMKAKYKLEKAVLKLPAKDQNSVAIELGDPAKDEFTPDLEISRWGGEVSMKMKPDISGVPADQKFLSFEGDKIKFATPWAEYHFYDLPDIPGGGYEFEVIYDQKPSSNIVSIPIETKNLDFFYQPELTPEEIARGAFRPENVVGSYAVYYKNGVSGDYSQAGGKNYQTGKAFHIYRPKIIDASNNWVWGELNINTDAGLMTITVPQDFLDSAVYPVIVDPTLGYTAIGASDDSGNSTYYNFLRYTTDASGGTASNIKGAFWLASGSGNVKMALYDDDGHANLPITNGYSGEVPVTQTTRPTQDYEWTSGKITASLSASTNYWLAHTFNNDSIYNAWDSAASVHDYYTPSVYADFPPNPAAYSGSDTTYLGSFYVIYSAVGGTSCGYICNGLVGYWPFNGPDMDWSINIAYDRSGQGNTGTMANMSQTTSPASGISGQALNFDGVDDYVDMGQKDLLTGTFSLSVWLKANSFSGYLVTQQKLVDSQDRLDISAANTLRYRLVSSLGTYYNYTATINSGQWYHAVMVVNSTVGTLYLNGVAGTPQTMDSGDRVADPSYKQFSFGSNGGASDFFNGLIDDVRVYNRALSQSEITELYRIGAGRLKTNVSIGKAGPQGGLVGNWTFDGQDTTWTSATAGTTNDLSGNNNTGTMTNMSRDTSPVPGISGQALSFDGVDDYINLPVASAPATGNFTVAMWFNPKVTFNSSTAIIDYLMKLGDSPSTNDINIYLEGVTGEGNVADGKLGFDVYNGSGWSSIGSTATSWTGGTWYHMAGTFSTTDGMILYINGVNDGTNANKTRGGTAATLLYLAKHFNSTTWNWQGLIDEVRVYNRALSAGEITELYRLGAARLKTNVSIGKAGPQGGLVGNWTFNGPDTTWTSATAGTTNDLSGQGNTGTMTNMSRSTSPSPGISGQALNFDGSDDYVNIGNAGSGIKTIAFWVKADGTTGTTYFKGKLDEVRFYSQALSASQIGELYRVGAGKLKFGGSGTASALSSARPTSKILDLDGGTNYIDVTNGTIAANGFSGTIYVDGSVASTIDNNWRFVAITIDAGINASAVALGKAGADDPCAGYLVCQGFEGAGYDNGESWGENVPAGATVDEDYTATVLDGSQSLFMESGSGTWDWTAAYLEGFTESHVYGYFMYRPVSTVGQVLFLDFRDSSQSLLLVQQLYDDEIRICTQDWGYCSDTGYYFSDGTTYHVWVEYQKGTGYDSIARVWLSTSATKPGSPSAEITDGSMTTDFTWVVLNQNGVETYYSSIFDKIRLKTSDIGSDPE